MRYSSTPMISFISLILSVEWIFLSLRISPSLTSERIDSVSDFCSRSTLLSSLIFLWRERVSCATVLSLSFLELFFLLYLKEILLPKYQPLGLSQLFLFSLNYLLAVLSQNLLEVEPYFAEGLLSRLGWRALEEVGRSRAELKRLEREGYYWGWGFLRRKGLGGLGGYRFEDLGVCLEGFLSLDWAFLGWDLREGLAEGLEGWRSCMEGRLCFYFQIIGMFIQRRGDLAAGRVKQGIDMDWWVREGSVWKQGELQVEKCEEKAYFDVFLSVCKQILREQVFSAQ